MLVDARMIIHIYNYVFIG